MTQRLITRVAPIGLLLALISVGVAQNRRQRIPEGFGIIQGRVLDTKGHPIARIRVYAERLGPGPDGIVPVVLTNRSGRFFLRVRTGNYQIYPVRDKVDFRDLSYELFPEWIANAVVYDQKITKGIVLQMNVQQAQLVGMATNVQSGQPVSKAEMLLCRTDVPSQCARTGIGGITSQFYRFRLIVPSIPLTIKVSARGYEDWYYGKDGSKERAEPLRLEPNTTKELTVSLKPLK